MTRAGAFHELHRSRWRAMLWTQGKAAGGETQDATGFQVARWLGAHLACGDTRRRCFDFAFEAVAQRRRTVQGGVVTFAQCRAQ